MPTNQEIIESVKRHQGNQYLHPLTCGKDSRHDILVPEERDGKVVLVCPTCGYVQTMIPECVTELSKEHHEALRDAMSGLAGGLRT